MERERGPALTCFLLGQPQAFICVTADCVHYHSCPRRGILLKKGKPGRFIHGTPAMAEWDPKSGCRALEHVIRTVQVQNGPWAPAPWPSPCSEGLTGPSGDACALSRCDAPRRTADLLRTPPATSFRKGPNMGLML